MNKAILGMVLACLSVSGHDAAADGVLNARESVEIRASLWKVWDKVKDFDALDKWHPMFASDVIKAGGNNEPGTIRTMTIKDGPSFDEELLTFDALERKFTYRLIDPVPLPVAEYQGSLQVTEGRRGHTLVVWSSAFRNHSDGKMKDEEVIALINDAFRVGLENLKAMLEGK